MNILTPSTGVLENTPRPLPLGVLFDSLLYDKWYGQEMWMARASLFFTDYYMLFLTAALMYYPVIFGLAYLMKNREPFKLRGLLMMWNFIMTVFSTVGFIMTAHAVLDSLFSGNMGYSIDQGVCGDWCFKYSWGAKLVFIFNVSKIFEFTDTLFVVLRKQPLIFLHYYHHLVTMLFCWYANQYGILLGNCGPYYFSLMNYGVHMTMYGYYFLRSMNYRPPFDILITIAQIVQMVGGMTVLYYMGSCYAVNHTLQYFGWALYFSFFLLFCWFFVKRYIFPSKRDSSAKKGQGGAKGGAKAGQGNANKSAASPSKKSAKVE